MTQAVRRLRNSLINHILGLAPPSLLTFRHEVNHLSRVKPWIQDEVVFLHVPKSGGTSVSRAYNRPDPGHYTYCSLSQRFPEVRNARLYYLVLRDPVDRLISTYNYVASLHSRFGTSNLPQVYHSSGISDFIKRYLATMDVERHYFLRPATKVCHGIPDDRLVVVNFRDLGRNLEAFMAYCGGPQLLLPRANVSSPAKSEMLRLDKEAERIVALKYADDIELLERLGERSFSHVSDL